jgi:hypothetical protein
MFRHHWHWHPRSVDIQYGFNMLICSPGWLNPRVSKVEISKLQLRKLSAVHVAHWVSYWVLTNLELSIGKTWRKHETKIFYKWLNQFNESKGITGLVESNLKRRTWPHFQIPVRLLHLLLECQTRSRAACHGYSNGTRPSLYASSRLYHCIRISIVLSYRLFRVRVIYLWITPPLRPISPRIMFFYNLLSLSSYTFNIILFVDTTSGLFCIY